MANDFSHSQRNKFLHWHIHGYGTFAKLRRCHSPLLPWSILCTGDAYFSLQKNGKGVNYLSISHCPSCDRFLGRCHRFIIPSKKSFITAFFFADSFFKQALGGGKLHWGRSCFAINKWIKVDSEIFLSSLVRTIPTYLPSLQICEGSKWSQQKAGELKL